MSLTDRDRKIVTFLIPVLLLAGYWFLLIGPKRDESAKLDTKLAEVETARDSAVASADAAASAKTDFAADFAEVLRVGKAIPTSVDMPSLLVQLDRAAEGTDIGFNSIKAGERTAAQPLPPTGTGGGAPVAAGGEQASSAPGGAVENANEAAETSDDANAEAGADPAAAATGDPAAAGGVPGLDSVQLDFTFTGDFFDLANFLHRLKRFVHLNNEKIVVDGRLMVVESFALKMKGFPMLEATMSAKVYLSPRSEGSTAGATPAGPGTATPAATAPTDGTAPAPAAPASTPTSSPTQ